MPGRVRGVWSSVPGGTITNWPIKPLSWSRVVAGGEELLSPGLTRRLIARTTQPAAANGDVFAQLTTREREVVALAAQGLSSDEITARPVISPATAKTHISHALTILGARDRAQLVALAYRHGLVEPG